MKTTQDGLPPGPRLDVAEYSAPPTNAKGETDGTEIRQKSPGVALPGHTPYGQLPEVPWSVGLPVVGISAAILLKRRLSH